MKMSNAIRRFVILLLWCFLADKSAAYQSSISFDDGTISKTITSASGAKYPLTLTVPNYESTADGYFIIHLNISNAFDEKGKGTNVGTDAKFFIGSTQLDSICTSVTTSFTADFQISVSVNAIRAIYSSGGCTISGSGTIVIPITVSCNLTGPAGKPPGTPDVFYFNLRMTFSISMDPLPQTIAFPDLLDWETIPWSSQTALSIRYTSMLSPAKCTITSQNNFKLSRGDNSIPYIISSPTTTSPADNQREFLIQESTPTQVIFSIINHQAIPVSGRYKDILTVNVIPVD